MMIKLNKYWQKLKLPKPSFPKLSHPQLNRMSDIAGNLGLLYFATFVLPALIPGGLDRYDWSVIIYGLVMTFNCWLFSIIIARKENL